MYVRASVLDPRSIRGSLYSLLYDYITYYKFTYVYSTVT